MARAFKSIVSACVYYKYMSLWYEICSLFKYARETFLDTYSNIKSIYGRLFFLVMMLYMYSVYGYRKLEFEKSLIGSRYLNRKILIAISKRVNHVLTAACH